MALRALLLHTPPLRPSRVRFPVQDQQYLQLIRRLLRVARHDQTHLQACYRH